jgi:hypothetical protein
MCVELRMLPNILPAIRCSSAPSGRDREQGGGGSVGPALSELGHVARATAMSAFSASIADEVNQPLSGIITNENDDACRLAVFRNSRVLENGADRIGEWCPLFVKSIIPSRKATKQYLGEEPDDET